MIMIVVIIIIIDRITMRIYLRLVAEHYPWFQSTYKAYPEAVQRADAAR